MWIGRVPFATTALASIIIMCLMMTVVPGCQKEVKPIGTVVLYTSVPTDIIDEVKAEFEKRQPGVELDIFRPGTCFMGYQCIRDGHHFKLLTLIAYRRG